MTLMNKLAATALLATVAFGSVAPARAHHIRQQPFVKEETIQLLETVESVGVHIVVDSPRCKKGLMGQALMSADRQRQYLLICATNHGNDLDELADTIRHEAIHVAQHCRTRRLGTAGNNPLFPDKAPQAVQLAAEHLHMPMDSYDRSQWYAEAEARVAAHVLEEDQVSTLVRQECSG